jgi:hypothetical protein
MARYGRTGLALGLLALAAGCTESAATFPARIELAATGSSYHYTRYPGTFVANCTNELTCGDAVRGKVPSSCGGSGSVPTSAIRITRSDFPEDDLIGQCCPTAVPTTELLGVKACPTVGAPGEPVMNSCGRLVTSGCAACPGFAITTAFCHARYHGAALETCYSETEGPPATQLGQVHVPELWPPRRETLTIDLVDCLEQVYDPCDSNLTAAEVVADPRFTITSVGSDPAGGEIEKVGPHTVALVPERSGTDVGGRTFHVGISYTNDWDVETALDCRWVVPHDQGRHGR